MSATVVAVGRRARARRWGRRVAAVTVPAVVATLAVLHPGAPVSQVDLNDGAVWLTNATAQKIGRYNPQVDELNAGLVVLDPAFDVLQDAQDVVLVERATVSVVDPASVTLGAQAALPPGAEVSMARGTVAVSVDGEVWARPLTLLGGLDVTSQRPDLTPGDGGRAVVARDGTVLAVASDGTLTRATVTEDGVTASRDGRFEGLDAPLSQLTAVGDQPVALAGLTLHTPSRAVDLSAYGSDLVLQQPGPRAATALVAAPTALLEVPLDGGAVREHRTGASGDPAAPVRVGACAHGAWASPTASSLQLCAGGEPQVQDLAGMTGRERLVFRVNRDVVVLNSSLDGRLWIPTEDPEERRPDWSDISPQDEQEDDEQRSTTQRSTQDLQAECTAQSAPPQAVDDEVGVRAGRTTVVSVIDNDTSSDCGILAISDFDQLPEDFGTLTPVHGGRAFQLTTQPGATGTQAVTYTISDGRGTSAPSTATVRLTVRTANAAPEQVRTGSMLVEQGAAAVYDVLPDFVDPDGDHLVLVSAVAAAGGTARARQDGHLTFTSDGSALGRQVVTVVVSDGTETVEGTLAVDVRPGGSLPPVIDPVHAVTYVDEPVVVRPLLSVRSLSREPVRLAGVDPVGGATLAPNLADGTFTFTGARAGTYYVPFLVTAPPQQASGIARIDVRERPEVPAPPTAVLDVALLPPGGEVTVAPLANDVDPAGGVLVLQSVEAPAESGLRVAVLAHELLHVTSSRVLDRAVTVSYTVSNGSASATGQVLVQPVAAPATQQPPVVRDAAVSVRAGGVVTIPVLEGAYDPDGDAVTLRPDLVAGPAAGEGLMFVAGDVLRYQAPSTPMVVHATVEVVDSAGNPTAAGVTVTVHAADPATKAPPRPVPLTARVFEGETIRIPVPLDGIDPDGDGVLLLGQDRAPAKGRIVQTGADHLVYEALPGELGTDTFTYAVEDWVGQRAVATVRVGIAARPVTSAQVVSRDDDVTVRPGQTVEVRVLANDVDTGGGELALDPVLRVDRGTGAAEGTGGVDARVDGRRVVVRAPREPGVVQVAYVALNARGGRDSALLTVTVDPDAVIAPPVAQDVVVPARETINRTSVEVDVLARAENPSGPLSDLSVRVHPSAAAVARVADDGDVVVTLVDHPQTLPYLLTNITAGLSAYGFITVPALGDFPPVLRPRAPALTVVAGQPLTIVLDEQVQVAPGRSARVGDHTKVSATKSDGSPLVVDDRTLRYTAQASYAGPASVSLEVGDGPPGDPATRTQVLTLPVTVLAAADHPPTFTPSVVDIGPGDSVRVNLTAFTSAPVATAGGTEGFTYRLTSPDPAGFSLQLAGSVLTVTTDLSVSKGTVAGVTLAVGYGTAGASVPGQVDFRVVASSEPLARVLHHVVVGAADEVSTVDVLEGAFTPFPQTPLTVVDPVVETPGAGTAEMAGSRLAVRPAAGFVGPMVTRFRVLDGSGDAEREVEGRVTVMVRGRPGTPAAPRAVEVGDARVRLAWDAPAANGEPISAYLVQTQPGGAVTECVSTLCEIGGLTNDVEHTFTVVARNAVGDSDPGPASAPVRPDARPFAPDAPRLTRGDTTIDVAWTPPENPGSAIREYELEVAPAPPGGASGATIRTPGTSLTLTGLTNGTAYTVRVRAINGAPEPGDWSAPSAPATPARAPEPPSAVDVQGGRRGDVLLTWAPPVSDGGSPVTGYRVVVDGVPQARLGPEVRQYSHPASPGVTYRFGVQAENAVGLSAMTDHQGEVWTVPTPVRDLVVRDVAADDTRWGRGQAELRWSPPADPGGQGVTITSYWVAVDGARVAQLGAGTTSWTTPATLSGGGHTFSVVAVSSRQEESEPATVAADVTTVAQEVTVADADTGTPGEVTFRWQPGGTGGTPVTGYRYTVEREGERELTGTQEGTSLTVEVTGSQEQWMRIRVWAVNARGESEGAAQNVTGRPRPAPPPAPPTTPTPPTDPEP